MNYTLWEDAEGKLHEIDKMDTQYIKNCMKCIKDTGYSIYTKKVADADKTEALFGPKWCYEHAENFLNAFQRELTIRKRIQRQEFPVFTIEQSCDTCDNYCEGKTLCKEWIVDRMEIFHQLEDEDLEVARRGGYVCNGIKYIVED